MFLLLLQAKICRFLLLQFARYTLYLRTCVSTTRDFFTHPKFHPGVHGRRHRALMRRKPKGGGGWRRRHRDNAVDSGQELPGVDEAARANDDDDDADALYTVGPSFFLVPLGPPRFDCYIEGLLYRGKIPLESSLWDLKIEII